MEQEHFVSDTAKQKVRLWSLFFHETVKVSYHKTRKEDKISVGRYVIETKASNSRASSIIFAAKQELIAACSYNAKLSPLIWAKSCKVKLKLLAIFGGPQV